MSNKDKRKHTVKQQKLITIISDNLGNKGKNVKNMYEMMLEAGYSEGTARQQSMILCRVKEDLKPIVEQLIKQRQEMIDRLEKTIDQASFKDLVSGVDSMTKNINLLSGEATERVKYEWNEYSDKADN